MDARVQEILDAQEIIGFGFKIHEAYNLREYCDKRIKELNSRYNFKTGADSELINYMLSKGWQPKVYTKKGNPKISNDILETLGMTDFLDLRAAKKIYSYLNTWVYKVDPDECIRHKCKARGTATGRVSHSNPNLGQIPSSKGTGLRKELGDRCRELFTAPEGFYMIGADLSGIEVRLLAHYLKRYDDGKFIDIVLNGDVHCNNADILESTRAIAKIFLYAVIYGGGIDRLSSILKKDARAKASIFNRTIKLDSLKRDIDFVLSKKGYLTTLDGSQIYCKETYKSLNYLLQSAGSVIAKRWMIIVDEKLKEYGYSKDVFQMAFVFDELQFAVRNGVDPEPIQKILMKSAIEAGRYYNLRLPIAAETKVGICWKDTH